MRVLLRIGVLLLAGAGLAAQNGTVPVPANIKAEGLAPIPASIPEKLRPYASFGRTALLGWHPSSNEIIVSNTSGAAPQIHRVPSPGTASVPLGEGVVPWADHMRQARAAFASIPIELELFANQLPGRRLEDILQSSAALLTQFLEA